MIQHEFQGVALVNHRMTIDTLFLWPCAPYWVNIISGNGIPTRWCPSNFRWWYVEIDVIILIFYGVWTRVMKHLPKIIHNVPIMVYNDLIYRLPVFSDIHSLTGLHHVWKYCGVPDPPCLSKTMSCCPNVLLILVVSVFLAVSCRCCGGGFYWRPRLPGMQQYIVACQGSGVSIKSHHPRTGKTTLPLLTLNWTRHVIKA